jgi:hypothetical protein
MQIEYVLHRQVFYVYNHQGILGIYFCRFRPQSHLGNPEEIYDKGGDF